MQAELIFFAQALLYSKKVLQEINGRCAEVLTLNKTLENDIRKVRYPEYL